MNKIRVNMAVEPNDIQTLHCSQYDTEERKFSVDLHENGVGVSPSSISNQLVYKSFKGGTEQILPTNTSTPNTSPIIADIQYKDGLREDEEFLYRESPSSVDGYAKIKEIRGNTLVWNQLHGTVLSTASQGGVTFTHTNDYTITLSNSATSGTSRRTTNDGNPFSIINGHKYLIFGGTDKSGIVFRLYQNGWNDALANPISLSGGVVIATMSSNSAFLVMQIANGTNCNNVVIVPQIIDLTQMFGSGNEPTIAEFEALFPLSYYAYDSGSLLSFNGSGIKTTNNLITNDSTKWGSYGLSSTGYSVDARRIAPYSQTLPCEVGKTYTVNMQDKQNRGTWNVGVGIYDNSTRIVDSGWQTLPYSFTVPSGAVSVRMAFRLTDNSDIQSTKSEIGTNINFLLYDEEHTLSLPISSYFPTGLKSAGSIYDQLDETGYITRVGEVDLGSLSWTYSGVNLYFYATMDNKKVGTLNLKCPMYETGSATGYANITDMQITSGISNSYLIIKNSNYNLASTFKSAMNGVKLYYELATPLENYGVVDLGSLTWTYFSGSGIMQSTLLADAKLKNTSDAVGNAICALYNTVSRNTLWARSSDKMIEINPSNTSEAGKIWVYDTSFTDADTFKNAMSGIYLLYELNEPKGITSASIVTNYGEMPLYNDNGELKADCIADVSQNSGFQIAKVKLKDENGEIYSNPFQIHIERSPQ